MHPISGKALVENAVSHLCSTLSQRQGWLIYSIEFPIIDCEFTAPGRSTLRLRLPCDNWNDLPPAAGLHTAEGPPLMTLSPDRTNVFNPGPHPMTQRPFIYIHGMREYHTHPSHVSDSWESLKNTSNYTLDGILNQLWNAWQKEDR
jgi:hypothetical protein